MPNTASVLEPVIKPVFIANNSGVLVSCKEYCRVMEGFRPGFVSYMKRVEGKRVVRGLHMPYHSAEGGLDTVGYGHKLLADEFDKYKAGLTEIQAERLLLTDMSGAATLAAIGLGLETWGEMSQICKEICVDFVFNLGKVGFLKFKNLIQALKDEDWEGIAAHHKRYYRTPRGEKRELKNRNEEFVSFFLKGNTINV